jgi:hypothetical protein
VLALAAEHRVWLHVDGHEQVARRTTAASWSTLARHAQCATVLDADGHAHLDGARLRSDADALAGGARVVDHGAPPVTGAAGLGEAEAALLPDGLTTAAARGAGVG